MSGIILYYEDKDVNFIMNNLSMSVDRKIIDILFSMYVDGAFFPQTYTVTLTGDDLISFYESWDNQSECYRWLCIRLGFDPSIVPENMDDEIIG